MRPGRPRPAGFFRGQVGAIDAQHPNLFAADAPQDAQADDDEGDEDGDPGPGVFRQKWGWVFQVDRIAALTRSAWDSVYKLTAVEFLNLICYADDKEEEAARQQRKQMQKRNG